MYGSITPGLQGRDAVENFMFSFTGLSKFVVVLQIGSKADKCKISKVQPVFVAEKKLATTFKTYNAKILHTNN